MADQEAFLSSQLTHDNESRNLLLARFSFLVKTLSPEGETGYRLMGPYPIMNQGSVPEKEVVFRSGYEVSGKRLFMEDSEANIYAQYEVIPSDPATVEGPLESSDSNPDSRPLNRFLLRDVAQSLKSICEAINTAESEPPAALAPREEDELTPSAGLVEPSPDSEFLSMLDDTQEPEPSLHLPSLSPLYLSNVNVRDALQKLQGLMLDLQRVAEKNDQQEDRREKLLEAINQRFEPFLERAISSTAASVDRSTITETYQTTAKVLEELREIKRNPKISPRWAQKQDQLNKKLGQLSQRFTHTEQFLLFHLWHKKEGPGTQDEPIKLQPLLHITQFNKSTLNKDAKTVSELLNSAQTSVLSVECVILHIHSHLDICQDCGPSLFLGSISTLGQKLKEAVQEKMQSRNTFLFSSTTHNLKLESVKEPSFLILASSRKELGTKPNRRSECAHDGNYWQPIRIPEHLPCCFQKVFLSLGASYQPLPAPEAFLPN